jgi:hypothetical protein
MACLLSDWLGKVKLMSTNFATCVTVENGLAAACAPRNGKYRKAPMNRAAFLAAFSLLFAGRDLLEWKKIAADAKIKVTD